MITFDNFDGQADSFENSDDKWTFDFSSFRNYQWFPNGWFFSRFHYESDLLPPSLWLVGMERISIFVFNFRPRIL